MSEDPASIPPPTNPPPITWKLPEGIDDHIYSGLIKTSLGVVAGAAVGVLMFRSGNGGRSASMAAGVGVALGSTVERARADSK